MLHVCVCLQFLLLPLYLCAAALATSSCMRDAVAPAALGEEAWFEVLLVKSDTVKSVQGGMSAIVGSLLNFMDGAQGHDMQRAGISLMLKDEGAQAAACGTSVRVFMSLGIILADESALHSVYGCKGSSGLKPCLLCQNIFSARETREIIQRDATGFAQPHTCTDAGKLVLHTPHTIAAIQRRLSVAAGSLSQEDCKELQTRLGWNYLAEGLLQQLRWRELADPTRTAMYDWMHVWLVSGVFNAHVGLMVRALKPLGITYEKLNQYVQLFRLPSSVKDHRRLDVFSAKRAKASWEDNSLKAAASECLSLFPIMGNYMQALVEKSQNATVRRHASAFVLLVEVMELLLQSARPGRVAPDALGHAIQAHLQIFRELYGAAAMTPKFHYTLHFPSFLQRVGFLPNCFALERKHKMPKRFANSLTNTSSEYEPHILRELTAHHVHSLINDAHRFGTGPCLIEPHRPSQTLLDTLQREFGNAQCRFETSRQARINEWERCSVGDVVLARTELANDIVGEVMFHASVRLDNDIEYISLLKRWELLQGATRSAKYRRSDAPLLIMTAEIVSALTWGGSDDSDVVTIIKPARL